MAGDVGLNGWVVVSVVGGGRWEADRRTDRRKNSEERGKSKLGARLVLRPLTGRTHKVSVIGSPPTTERNARGTLRSLVCISLSSGD